jgi:DNA-binding GntR family transcriptional regulator
MKWGDYPPDFVLAETLAYRLDEMELAHRFQVSRTPVREAIRQLGASGLLDIRPHRSAVVARPDRLQVLGMVEALREPEALCTGFAAERMTGPEQGDLRRLHRSLKPAVRLGDAQRYHEINERFHAAVYAGSHNAHLMKLTAETRARIAPFSRAQFRTMGRLAKSYAEREAVVTAICKGQREEARRSGQGLAIGREWTSWAGSLRLGDWRVSLTSARKQQNGDCCIATCRSRQRRKWVKERTRSRGSALRVGPWRGPSPAEMK